MQAATIDVLRHQLEDRRDRLTGAIAHAGPEHDLVALLRQVDSALARMGDDDYGVCLVCHTNVNESDLLHNPLMRYCLCDLSPAQQKSLEHDLELATRIQSALLPDPHLACDGWDAAYRYEPAGPVSGDYCDFWEVPDRAGALFFAIGDVSGKGVAASLLMAHLQAAFRSLPEHGTPITDLVSRVNRQLMAASIPTHYATLVAGRAERDGTVELVNAGHCLPLVARSSVVEALPSTGLPVGLFAERPYDSVRVTLAPGESLVLYTDGLSEARRADGAEYGQEGIERHLRSRAPGGGGARQIVHGLRSDVGEFLGDALRTDDLTILALHRAVR